MTDPISIPLLGMLRAQAKGKPLAVVAIDLETGEQEVKFTDDYCLVVMEPWRLTYETINAKSIQLTMRKDE